MRHRPANDLMAEEVTDQIFIHGKGRRLADVVQERRQTECFFRLYSGYNVQRVLPDIQRMMRIILTKTDAGRHLRDQHTQYVREFFQHLCGMRPCQDSGKLLAQALLRYLLQFPAQRMNRGRSLRRKRKAQPGGKAESAQHPQRILGEAGGRLPDAANHALRQIPSPPEQVDHPSFRIRSHRVDGKVAAHQIRVQLRQKNHRVGVAAVRIAPLRAEGRDFIGLSVPKKRNRPEALSGQNYPFVRKTGRSLLRLCAGTQVPVLRRLSAQAVAHTAADGVCLKAGRGQPHQNRSDLRRDGDTFHCHPSLLYAQSFSLQ